MKTYKLTFKDRLYFLEIDLIVGTVIHKKISQYQYSQTQVLKNHCKIFAFWGFE